MATMTAVGPGRIGGRHRLSPATRRNLRNGLLFISPWLLGVAIFTAYPILATVYYGFTDYNGVTFPPHWVGLHNYTTLLTNDPQFWPAVANTIWWACFSVPLAIVFGVILALLLNIRIRGIGVYRTLFYMPSDGPRRRLDRCCSCGYSTPAADWSTAFSAAWDCSNRAGLPTPRGPSPPC